MENIKKAEVLSALRRDVESMKTVLDTCIVKYETWVHQYQSFENLQSLGNHYQEPEILDLARKLGRSLVDADVVCIFDAQKENLAEFKREIKEQLGSTKKLTENK